MDDVYVARQPIFDKNRKIHGYELLFRDGTANMFSQTEGDTATTTLLSNTFFSIGIDTLTDGNKAFINFTQNLLEKKVPLLLPKETVVVEILEDVKPGPKLVDACRKMAAAGYTLALDDFVYSAELMPLIVLADIIKFDFRLTPTDTISAYLAQLPQKRIQLLAEKVETAEEFETAKAMGFDLFQGYFFCRPEMIKGREIQGSQLNLMNIMIQANRPDFSVEPLAALISRDVGFSYKLFKYANATFFGRTIKVSSVKDAMVYLGESEIRRFVSLVAMSRLAEGKTDELIRMASVRGKFCELLSMAANEPAPPPEMFTMGMFSLIDAILEHPMAQAVAPLPLSDAIKTALIHEKGRLAGYLELMRAYEYGQWEQVSCTAGALKINPEKIPSFYLHACQWADAVRKPVW